MDIQMPDPSAGPGQALDEINATRILHREMPRVGIVFCAMYEDDEVVFVGPKAGGWGQILKESDPDATLCALRAVANGESLLGLTLAQKVSQQFAALSGKAPSGMRALCDDLAASSEVVELAETYLGASEYERYYYAHSLALRANGHDDQADEYLRRAHEWVTQVAANIRDERLRQSWLENVPDNREIVAEWEARAESA